MARSPKLSIYPRLQRSTRQSSIETRPEVRKKKEETEAGKEEKNEPIVQTFQPRLTPPYPTNVNTGPQASTRRRRRVRSPMAKRREQRSRSRESKVGDNDIDPVGLKKNHESVKVSAPYMEWFPAVSSCTTAGRNERAVQSSRCSALPFPCFPSFRFPGTFTVRPVSSFKTRKWV